MLWANNSTLLNLFEGHGDIHKDWYTRVVYYSIIHSDKELGTA